MAIRSDDKLNDIRVRHTRRALRRAFSEMCVEIPAKQINVSRLAERAGIDRKTFYLHYAGLNDVMDDIELEMMKDLRPDLSDRISESGLGTSLNVLYSYMNERHELMYRLLYDPAYQHFSDKFMHDVLDSACFKGLCEHASHVYAAYLATDMLSCIFRVIYCKQYPYK